jgi:holo-[acyl-carrier protein] synthase
VCSPRETLRAAADPLFHDAWGVGIDLVDIDVLRRLLASGGAAFVDGYWSTRERAEAGGDVTKLAGRWAAKEAVMKSLGAGIGDVDPLDIEVLTLDSGAPHVVLHRAAARSAEALDVTRCLVSITHESAWAAAVAVALKASRQPAAPPKVASEGVDHE